MDALLKRRPRRPALQTNQQVAAKDGTLYRTGRTVETLGTLRRAVPKVKGKQARRADKQRRRIARETVT